MTIPQRNYRAFQYLLKKKPREYRGVWLGHFYHGVHLYQLLIPGMQLGKKRILFHITRKEVDELENS